MRRTWLLAALVLVLSACQKDPPPPKLSQTPRDGNVEAGASIEVRAAKPLGYQKEAFTYEWKMTGDCAGELEDPTSNVVSYQIPEDCKGGRLVFHVASTTKYGTTEHDLAFDVAAAEEEDPGLQPLRPDPLPASWTMLNTYEKVAVADKDNRRNTMGGYFGTWPHREGKCELEKAQDTGSDVLAVRFTLPHDDLSMCGYFDYFSGPRGGAEKTDLSGYDKFGFIARTEPGKKVRVRVEVVEFDKYANFNQGIVTSSDPITVTGDWRRYEVDFGTLVRTWDLASTKSIGFRIDSRDNSIQEGVLYLDNLALVGGQPKAKAPTDAPEASGAATEEAAN